VSFEGFGRRRPDARQVSAIKGWAREAFGLGDDVTVLVSELTCTEPGCPPLETVVALLRGPGDQAQHKLYKGVAEVTRDDLVALARGEAPGHDHAEDHTQGNTGDPGRGGAPGEERP